MAPGHEVSAAEWEWRHGSWRLRRRKCWEWGCYENAAPLCWGWRCGKHCGCEAHRGARFSRTVNPHRSALAHLARHRDELANDALSHEVTRIRWITDTDMKPNCLAATILKIVLALDAERLRFGCKDLHREARENVEAWMELVPMNTALNIGHALKCWFADSYPAQCTWAARNLEENMERKQPPTVVVHPLKEALADAAPNHLPASKIDDPPTDPRPLPAGPPPTAPLFADLPAPYPLLRQFNSAAEPRFAADTAAPQHVQVQRNPRIPPEYVQMFVDPRHQNYWRRAEDLTEQMRLAQFPNVCFGYKMPGEHVVSENDALRPPREGGHFAWNRHGDRVVPSAPVGQPSPLPVSFNSSALHFTREWIYRGGILGQSKPQPALAAQDVLLTWLHHRPSIRRAIEECQYQRPANISPLWPQCGWWMTCHLSRNSDRPQSAAPISLSPEHQGVPLRTSFHGTRLQSLASIMQRGLQVGTSKNSDHQGGFVSGIFSYPEELSHKCSQYAVFSPLGDIGWAFCALLEIRSPAWDAFGRKTSVPGKSKDSRQWLSYPDSTEIVKLHFFAIHMSDAVVFPELTTSLSVSVEPRYWREGELSPTDSWAAILAKSVPQGPHVP